jgi:hypothetical protein
MEQLVILLVIGAISLINWLLQRSAEHKKKRGRSGAPESSRPSSDMPPWAGPEPDETLAPTTGAHGHGREEAEEQMRRFFEALGLPAADEAGGPPDISLPFDPEPPPLQPLPQPRVVATPAAPAKRTLRQNREMKELAEQFERSAIDAASDTGTTAAFRELLQNPSTIRQGIILREILGPPKALE